MGDQKAMVTVPAAAAALGVSRIVIDRAIKSNSLETLSFNSGGKNPGFRLIPVGSFKGWLQGREGYHSTSKSGDTTFHPWNDHTNPESVVEKALTITNTSRSGKPAAKKAKKKAKAA